MSPYHWSDEETRKIFSSRHESVISLSSSQLETLTLTTKTKHFLDFADEKSKSNS
jgi:hypothetical protein